MFSTIQTSLASGIVDKEEHRYQELRKELLAISSEFKITPEVESRIRQFIIAEVNYLEKRKEGLADPVLAKLIKAHGKTSKEAKESSTLDLQLNEDQKIFYVNYQRDFTLYNRAVWDYQILKDLADFYKDQDQDAAEQPQQEKLNKLKALYNEFKELRLKNGMYRSQHEKLLRAAWEVFKSCDYNKGAPLYTELVFMRNKLMDARIEIEAKRFPEIKLKEIVLLGEKYNSIKTAEILETLQTEEKSREEYIDALLFNAEEIIRPKFALATAPFVSVETDIMESEAKVTPMLSPEELTKYNILIENRKAAKKAILCNEEKGDEFRLASDRLNKALKRNPHMYEYHLYRERGNFLTDYAGVSMYRAQWNEKHSFGFFHDHEKLFRIAKDCYSDELVQKNNVASSEFGNQLNRKK